MNDFVFLSIDFLYMFCLVREPKEPKFCNIVDCAKEDSIRFCPKTCAERPIEDSGKNH